MLAAKADLREDRKNFGDKTRKVIENDAGGEQRVRGITKNLDIFYERLTKKSNTTPEIIKNTLDLKIKSTYLELKRELDHARGA